MLGVPARPTKRPCSYAAIEKDDMSYKTSRPHVDWRCADLSGTNMTGMSLRNADLRAANLSGCNFTASDLSYADLRGANVQGATFQNANLYGAKMQGVTAQQADFRNADLRQCNLGGAYLEGAMLSPVTPQRHPSPAEIAQGRGSSGPEPDKSKDIGMGL
jgi:uncharacterized protein YjbI with pentapeptide repeats